MIICNIAPRTLAIILAVAAVAVTLVIWYSALCVGHDDDFDDDDCKEGGEDNDNDA